MASQSTLTDKAELLQLEALCRAFYEGSPEEQRRAHELLLPLTSDTWHIPKLQAVLSQSSDLHALIFAANGLNNIFTSNWTSVSTTQQEDTKKFLLNYLYQTGSGLLTTAPLVMQVFVRLLVRIVKLSWIDNVTHQSIVDQVNEFLQASTAHWIVGLTIYTELTSDMQPQLGPQIGRQRRAALSFKDNSLSKIAKVAVHTLQQLKLGTMGITDVAEERKLLQRLLQLMHNCLSFDFMGIVPDETTDEQATVMVPHTWNFLKDRENVTMFFDLYQKSWSMSPPWIECAPLCLQCLTLLASFRRSFFLKEADRNEQIGQLIDGTSTILQKQLGLANDNCYHETCRLLGKINGANQFSELMTTPGFSVWLEQAYRFTMQSLANWTHLPNSKHYLLGLWSGMLGLRARRHPSIERYISEVTIAYIDSRMLIAEAVAVGDDCDIENPLENEVLKAEQLEAISLLGRCRYRSTASYVAQLFDRTNREMREGVITQETYQHKISWLIYMIAALVGGYTLLFSSPKQSSFLLGGDYGGEEDGPSDAEAASISAETINGELAARAFQLIVETDTYPSVPEQLELAYLNFLNEFKKYLIFNPSRTQTTAHRCSVPPLNRGLKYSAANTEAEPEPTTETATSRICEILGLADEEAVFGLIIRKIIFNLQKRSANEATLKGTLQLLMLLCSGLSVVHSTDHLPHLVMPGKLLLRNPTIQEVMANHSSTDFAFLTIPRYAKYRASYFSSLTRLLFIDIRIADGRNEKLDSRQFDVFMTPLANTFAQLSVGTADAPVGADMGDASIGVVQTVGQARRWMQAEELRNITLKVPLIGLLRDLAGVCLACSTSAAYLLFFDWMVDKPRQPGKSRVDLLAAIADAWWDDHEVMIPLLKFVAEFVYNKGHRITFDSSSANGVLLFKEVSSILLAYGRRIASKQFTCGGGGGVVSSSANSAMLYKEKYKGIAKALEMFSFALSGNYTNFGVFEVYQDSSLSNSLSLALELCLVIPNEDLQAFMKTLKPVYSFLEVVTRSFMSQLLALEPSQLAAIVKRIEDGLCSFETGVSMQCCAALDHVVKYIYENVDSEKEEGQAARAFLSSQPEALKRVLQVIFQLVMSGEMTSTWSLSRPMLGLILLQESEFLNIKAHFTDNSLASAEQKEKMERYFQELMSSVDRNLTVKNRDTFTRNLFQFVHHLKASMV